MTVSLDSSHMFFFVDIGIVVDEFGRSSVLRRRFRGFDGSPKSRARMVQGPRIERGWRERRRRIVGSGGSGESGGSDGSESTSGSHDCCGHGEKIRNWFAVFLFCEAKPGTVLLRFESDSRVNWIQFMEGSALLLYRKSATALLRCSNAVNGFVTRRSKT